MQRSSSENSAGGQQSSVSWFASGEVRRYTTGSSLWNLWGVLRSRKYCDFSECLKKKSAWVEFLSMLGPNFTSGKKWTAGFGTVSVQMHKCSLSWNRPKTSQAHSYLWCKCCWSVAIPFISKFKNKIKIKPFKIIIYTCSFSIKSEAALH